MKKLFGKKIKVAVFISGRGSNLKKLIYFSKNKKSKFKVDLVVTNKRHAPGLVYAKKNKINFKIYEFKKKIPDEMKILNLLKKKKIKIVCLAGFMKILSQKFIQKFKGKIINIHPSLLPKYKGLNTHQRAINNKEKFAGCTVHYVNSRLDSGKIILQKKVKILKTDSSITLAKRILKQEHILYPKALKKVLINL